MIPVKSRISRILKKLPKFYSIDEVPYYLIEVLGEDIAVKNEDNAIIGIYENEERSNENCIIFTELSLGHYKNKKIEWIKYSDICAKKYDHSKENLSSIDLILKDGTKYILPVFGFTGKYRDVFEFIRFFSRILEDKQFQSYDQ